MEHWQEQGSKDAARRAHDRWRLLLDQSEAPPIDPGTPEALNDHVARHKADLPDAWCLTAKGGCDETVDLRAGNGAFPDRWCG